MLGGGGAGRVRVLIVHVSGIPKRGGERVSRRTGSKKDTKPRGSD